MELLPIAYCCMVPLLLLLVPLPPGTDLKKQGANLLATMNLLMIFHSIFLVRQLIGLLLLAQTLSGSFHVGGHSLMDSFDGFAWRNLVIIVLPLLFIRKPWRLNAWLSIFLLVLVYWNHPIAFWNIYNIGFKILAFCCLFCAAYALLWLLHQLPYQFRQ